MPARHLILTLPSYHSMYHIIGIEWPNQMYRQCMKAPANSNEGTVLFEVKTFLKSQKKSVWNLRFFFRQNWTFCCRWRILSLALAGTSLLFVSTPCPRWVSCYFAKCLILLCSNQVNAASLKPRADEKVCNWKRVGHHVERHRISTLR